VADLADYQSAIERRLSRCFVYRNFMSWYINIPLFNLLGSNPESDSGWS